MAVVTLEVITDLAARMDMGEKKYGRNLETFNGRDALKDAYQEALDLTQYLKQRLMEDDVSKSGSFTPRDLELMQVAVNRWQRDLTPGCPGHFMQQPTDGDELADLYLKVGRLAGNQQS
jgi:hypothetical protein